MMAVFPGVQDPGSQGGRLGTQTQGSGDFGSLVRLLFLRSRSGSGLERGHQERNGANDTSQRSPPPHRLPSPELTHPPFISSPSLSTLIRTRSAAHSPPSSPLLLLLTTTNHRLSSAGATGIQWGRTSFPGQPAGEGERKRENFSRGDSCSICIIISLSLSR